MSTEIGEDDWRPDEQLVPALLAGSPTTMADLCPADRAWAVASMKLEGLTAEQIKERLECSLRLVRSIAADPGAIFARLYLIEREAFGDTLRMMQSEVARLDRERAEAISAADRYKRQLDGMLDRLMTGETGPAFPKCGHPKTRYNTYVAPKTGKESCRMCHADAQRRYEERKAARPGQASPAA
ncbi:helix-turn-helix DNA-binding domain protein [Mycobacterium phage PenguinLover67]|nr:helix-turn-helix DNA-binding domain protein [Mycobacterium phage PenguinLover67]